MSDSGIAIKLGAREYRVVAQGIGRIRRKLTAALGLLGDDVEAELDEQLYDALKVFIPDLAPKWELLGYRSQEALDADDYSDAEDRSPTGPQIADALDAIYRANGGDRFARLLGNVIGPELIRAWVRTQGLQALSASSTSSASPKAGPPSTSSTPTGPTPEESPRAPRAPEASEPTPPTEAARPASADSPVLVS